MRPEELDIGQMGSKVTKTIPNDVIGQMPIKLNDEAVLPKSALRRPRLQIRQVDIPRCELPQDPVERAGSVRILEAHNQRSVMSRRRWDSILCHRDKPCLVLRVILNVRRQDLKPVKRCGKARGDRAVVRSSFLPDPSGCMGGRRCRNCCGVWTLTP